MCQDMNLPIGAGLLIAKSIHEQINGYRQQQISKMKIGIIPICLRVNVGNYLYFDTFEYDTDNPFNSPEVLASITVAELALPPDVGPIIATSILEQIIHTKQIYYYAYMKAVQQILYSIDESETINDEKSTISSASKKRKLSDLMESDADADVQFLRLIGDINQDDKILASTRQYSQFDFNGFKNIWEFKDTQAPLPEKKKDGRGRPKKDATLQKEKEEKERALQAQLTKMAGFQQSDAKKVLVEKVKIEQALNYDGDLREKSNERHSLIKAIDTPEDGKFFRTKGEILTWGPRIIQHHLQSHTCNTMDMLNLIRPSYGK